MGFESPDKVRAQELTLGLVMHLPRQSACVQRAWRRAFAVQGVARRGLPAVVLARGHGGVSERSAPSELLAPIGWCNEGPECRIHLERHMQLSVG